MSESQIHKRRKNVNEKEKSSLYDWIVATQQCLCMRILRMNILFKNNKKQISHYFITMSINFQNQNQGYKLIVTSR